MPRLPLSQTDSPGFWLDDPAHRAYLQADAAAQFAFFRPSLRADGGFDVLDPAGTLLPRQPQELHTTTRLVHCYGLGHSFGQADCLPVIDAGMRFL